MICGKKLLVFLFLLVLSSPLFSQGVYLTEAEYSELMTLISELETENENLTNELTISENETEIALKLYEEEKKARTLAEVSYNVLETSLKTLETDQIIDKILYTFGGGVVGFAAGLTMNVSAKN